MRRTSEGRKRSVDAGPVQDEEGAHTRACLLSFRLLPEGRDWGSGLGELMTSQPSLGTHPC